MSYRAKETRSINSYLWLGETLFMILYKRLIGPGTMAFGSKLQRWCVLSGNSLVISANYTRQIKTKIFNVFWAADHDSVLRFT
jgi:hypothetical protein